MRLLSILVLISAASAQTTQSPEPIEAMVNRMFEKDRRMKMMNLPGIVEKLAIGKGSQVADIGCGPGGFSAVIGHVVGPQGVVYCVDKSDEDWALKQAKKLFKKEKLKNVKTIEALAEDPKLAPASLDAVLIVNAYHEFEKYPAVLEKARGALKPGGRLVLVENVPRKVGKQSRKIQMDNHVMSADIVEPEIKAAGFDIVERDDDFIDHPEDESIQWMIVATPVKKS